MPSFLLRSVCVLLVFVFLLALPRPARAQRLQEREQEFLTTPPRVGEELPDVTVYSADGQAFRTAELRGHYTVLTFGCLTCPPSMWNIAGLEAVHHDYRAKGVKFYFIYKSLAHPELAGNYVQPFTLQERLAHAQQAKLQLGTEIPWLVDAMDNRLKRALGDRPNSQFLIDPQGVVIGKRAWSNPAEVRKDLEGLVGAVEKITRIEDLHPEFAPPLKPSAARGLVPRLSRADMKAIVIEPQINTEAVPFYAKLRAEADAELLADGAGTLYIGFHLDPFHQASWNNLVEPLSCRIDASANVELEQTSLTANKVAVASDADPREFLVHVRSWPRGETLRLTVSYAVCDAEQTCLVVQQSYLLHRRRDIDGGGARGEGAGFWEAKEFTKRLLATDEDQDGKLNRDEAVGIIMPHFEQIDRNGDSLLDPAELSVVTDWLNHHHRSSVPRSE